MSHELTLEDLKRGLKHIKNEKTTYKQYDYNPDCPYCIIGGPKSVHSFSFANYYHGGNFSH